VEREIQVPCGGSQCYAKQKEFIVSTSKRNKRLFSIALVPLNVHIIAPINDSPLVSVLYPSDNTL
jgi:hypothetical protein